MRAGVFNDRTGSLVCLKVIPADTDVMMITDTGVIIRVQADEISKISRNTQGVRIMKLKDSNINVMAIALTPHEDEEVEEGEQALAEDGENAETEAVGETTETAETTEE